MKPTSSATTPSNLTSQCGPVVQYYGATADDWASTDTTDWLNEWWTFNEGNFSENGGFAPTFGLEYLGDPNWSCRADGSPDDCTFDPCNQPALNGAGPDVEHAYLVLESVRNFHNYFQGLSEAFQISGIFASLEKDNWAYTFYTDKNDLSKVDLVQLINAITTVVGVVAAFAAPFEAGIKIAAAASNTLFAGGVNGVKYAMTNRLVYRIGKLSKAI